MPDPNSQSIDARRRWLIETLAAHLTEVIGTMTGDRPAHEWRPDAAPGDPLADGAIIYRQPFKLLPAAALWIVAPQEAWKQASERILKVAGIDDADAETVRGTYLEIVSQTSSALAREMSSRLHREVSTDPGEEAELPAGLTDWFSITLKFGEAAIDNISVAFTSELVDGLAAPAPETAAPTAPEPEVPRTIPTPSVKPGSLELLLDVELPVSVSFGRAQLALKDVIKLTTGSIVELNRTVVEPVEVIVNNCVIARGEVVVVEGNFGVRILQVISRQERLRTLD